MDVETAKKIAARTAAELIPPHTHLGLGSGSTVVHFIEALAERLKQGFHLRAVVPCSHQSFLHAMNYNLPIQDLNDVQQLDLTIDGADQIDPQKRMVKGGGGALVRERIIASASKELLIIVDESKLVSSLGKKIPVEVLPFGSKVVQHKLEQLGYPGTWRSDFVTENGNLILDLHPSSPLTHPEEDHVRIRSVPGVLDTGLFLHMAGRVIIGYFNGKIEMRD
jgi:ribose 5-phosphate isomerase A